MAPTFRQRVAAAFDALFTPVTTEERAAPKKGMSDLQRLAAADTPRVDKSPIILGPSMSPVTVNNALRRADRGYMRALCDLLTEQRETVTHLQGELGKRESAIASCALVVEPAKTIGKGKSKQAEKIADFVRARAGSIEGLHDAIKHLAGAIYYGRSGLETEWFRDRDGLGIRALHPVYPNRLSYVDGWKVHLYDEAGNDVDPRLGRWPGVDIRREWPDKFVIHEPKTLGPVPPTRQGLGRVLVWAGMFWKWDAKHWMQFAELFANPWRIGTYEKHADLNPEDIEGFKRDLANLGGMSTAVFPKGCEPIFLEAKDSKVHRELLDTWNAEISKVINGGTLATEMDGEGGSRAAAEVHEREGGKLKIGDGRDLDTTLMRDLWRPLVRRQFGREAAETLCPIVRLDTIPPENIDAKTKRILAFIDRGGKLPMGAVREVLTGMPEPKDDEELMLPLAAIKPVAMAATTADGEHENEGEEPDEKDDKAEEAEPEDDAEEGEDEGSEDE